jgi:hypothetical protein
MGWIGLGGGRRISEIPVFNFAIRNIGVESKPVFGFLRNSEIYWKSRAAYAGYPDVLNAVLIVNIPIFRIG